MGVVTTSMNPPVDPQALAALLREWGCIVIAAADEAQAIAALAHLPGPPEVIIADYHLDRGVLGDQLAERLRARLGQSTPTVIVTADRDAELRKRLATEGVHLLAKPLKPSQLRALLRYLISLAEP